MDARKQLRKPENWQDFETLCKKLWGEIWDCPEIKKNGRSGQSQMGVDIYGIPEGENEYYGIQCKGKDEYSHKQLTQEEIDSEIEKAKNFRPPLKKFYFATTANKDTAIEQYIREKDLELRKNGLFEVHIFSWEDIVELIDENKRTHDWYVNSQKYKTRHQVSFTFQDNSEEFTSTVPFVKKVTHYKLKPILPVKDSLSALMNFENADMVERIKLLKKLSTSPSFYKVNHSYSRFSLKLRNVGTEPIKEYKIFLNFEGEFENIDTCSNGLLINAKYDTYIWNEDKSGKIVPLKNILVPEDTAHFDDICIKPKYDDQDIKIKWRLISENYKDEGELLLHIKTDLRTEETTVFVEDDKFVRIEETIEDIITD